MTATDARYGRRGGGWVPSKPPRESKPRSSQRRARCAVCDRLFWPGSIRPTPRICGRLRCRMIHDWGSDDWAGRARMARARERADVELDDLDRQALDRATGDRDD